MSLLMQALKKAERAKQNALPEEDQDKPSEAFDEVLALTPEPAPEKPLTAAELSLEPMDGLSLEPLAPPVAAASAEPRPSPSPLPAVSDHKAPGLTMDLALDPVAAAPALAPASDPALSTATAAPTAGPSVTANSTSARSAAAMALAADAGLEPLATARTASATAAAPATAANATAAASGTTAGTNTIAKAAATSSRSASAAQGGASAGAHTGASAGNGARGGATGSTPPADTGRSTGTGAASRTRARAAATTEPSGLDPERLRLIGLIALLVLLVGGFGIYYWRALTAPGAGAGLPPVPMPGPGATGATPATGLVIAAGPAARTDVGAGNPAAPDETDPMLAPSGAGSSRVQQELERRLSKTEQDLAAAQQTLHAVAANPRRAEQMPVLAAPSNSDIRVSRAQQTSPVAPALDSAYQAFNSGDLGAAQQQYAAALSQDANNRDALLGAAHVAARQNQKDQAAAYYLRLLELSPNDADATAGLIGLRQGDISLSEARLKAILANNPEAGPVLFALGNLYAQQGRWSDAQQSYFRAVGAAPDNPDYAYNLAIGLDRLNQSRLALGYYQRALALAQDKAVGFDRNALRQRMHELGGAPKQ